MGLTRLSGVAIDRDRLDYEIGRRGVTQRRFSEVTGIPEPTLSRARHGRPVTPDTLRRITNGLLRIPLLVGADMLLAEPEKKTAGASTPSAVQEEASASGRPAPA